MSHGIQPDDGEFVRKTREELEEDLLERAEDVFDAGADLDSQGSPLKQILDLGLLEQELTWQALEDVYYSGYYQDAHGEQLDKLLSIAMMRRIPRRGATGEITFTTTRAATEDITIERGAVVTTQATEDTPAIPFKTTDTATLSAGSYQVGGVPIRALEPWETDLGPEWLGASSNVAAESIVRIESRVNATVTGVLNPLPTGARQHGFVRGRDREDDDEFRQRYEETLGAQGAASLDNIRATIRNTAGVENVGMEENVTMDDNTGSGGLPPKSFRATVLHTTNRDAIAQAIVDSRAGGIQSYGAVSGTATTDDGVERAEYFNEADQITVEVTADLTADDTFPDDGNLQAENNIVAYIGGTTQENEDYDGVDMEEDVVYDLVHQAAMNVRGVYRADVQIGVEGAGLGTGDIVVEEFEVANTEPTLVTITSTVAERP